MTIYLYPAWCTCSAVTCRKPVPLGSIRGPGRWQSRSGRAPGNCKESRSRTPPPARRRPSGVRRAPCRCPQSGCHAPQQGLGHGCRCPPGQELQDGVLRHPVYRGEQGSPVPRADDRVQLPVADAALLLLRRTLGNVHPPRNVAPTGPPVRLLPPAA